MYAITRDFQSLCIALLTKPLASFWRALPWKIFPQRLVVLLLLSCFTLSLNFWSISGGSWRFGMLGSKAKLNAVVTLLNSNIKSSRNGNSLLMAPEITCKYSYHQMLNLCVCGNCQVCWNQIICFRQGSLNAFLFPFSSDCLFIAKLIVGCSWRNLLWIPCLQSKGDGSLPMGFQFKLAGISSFILF